MKKIDKKDREFGEKSNGRIKELIDRFIDRLRYEYRLEDKEIIGALIKTEEQLIRKEVLTLNATSGETEWQLPTEIRDFAHDGEMYRIETDEGDLLVSPEHKVYVKLNQYNNKGVGFSLPVFGSTLKPSVSRTTTPSRTLSIISEIQMPNGFSFPSIFIHALPVFTFIIPAPVETSSSLTALIPSSSANFSGRTVKLAPVSTNALTTFECFFSKSDISISTHECPIMYRYGKEIFKSFGKKDLSDFKLTKILDIYNNLEENKNKQLVFLDESRNEIKVKSISKENYNGKIYDVTVPNHIILVKRGDLIVWSGNSYNNFTGLADGSHSFKAYAQDLGGNVNATETRQVTVDTIAPSWSGNETNASPSYSGYSYQFNITVSDNIGGSFWSFSWNDSGTWDNATNSTWYGTSQKLIVNKTITASAENIIAYRWYANDSAGNWNNSELRTLNITSLNTAPTIPYVESGISANPTANTTTTVYFTFNASDSNGASDINVSRAAVNITLNAPGGQSRDNTSCTNISTSGNIVQFNCSVKFYYYDNSSSNWVINATIYDNSNEKGINDTWTFTYNSLSAMYLVRANLTFSNLYLGQQDVAANSPIMLNNTGNFDFTSVNITAYDLVGISNPSYTIGVGNFTVNITGDVAGIGRQLVNKTAINVTDATLPHKLNDAATNANESLYFWLDVPDNTQIIVQDYNSTTFWIIAVG